MSELETVTRTTQPIPVCTHCGTPIREGARFCLSCGAPTAAPAPTAPTVTEAPTVPAATPYTCTTCGTQLMGDQAFCAHCGTPKAAATPRYAPIPPCSATVEPKKSKKFIPLIIVGAVVSVLILALLLPRLLITPASLMEKGDYIAAYEKANADEKTAVAEANAVAVCSALCVDSLKDAESFDLREAWYSSTHSVVMKVAANNSFGNTVINYWYYTWDEDDEEYSLLTSVSSLEDDTIYSWDTTSERLEKAVDNLARTAMKGIMTSAYAIPEEDVDNINDLFEKGLLDDVELIDLPERDD